MPKIQNWTRDQLLIAFKLYSELPFGKMHSRNPQIIQYAALIGRTPSALAMKLTNIASLDPNIRTSGRTGLTGASSADRNMWEEMNNDWESFVEGATQAEEDLSKESRLNEFQGIDASDEIERDYTGRERTAQTNVRIGQNFFRRAVLSAYDSTCCISGLSDVRLLFASHIIPWRVDPRQRLNPRNGLCLSAIHDRAFDLGIITIAEDMSVRVAQRYLTSDDKFFKTSILSFHGSRVRMPEKFEPEPALLAFHRDSIFEG